MPCPGVDRSLCRHLPALSEEADSGVAFELADSYLLAIDYLMT